MGQQSYDEVQQVSTFPAAAFLLSEPQTWPDEGPLHDVQHTLWSWQKKLERFHQGIKGRFKSGKSHAIFL